MRKEFPAGPSLIPQQIPPPLTSSISWNKGPFFSVLYSWVAPFLTAGWGLGETAELGVRAVGQPLLASVSPEKQKTLQKGQQAKLPRWFSFITLFTYPSQEVFTENPLHARLPIMDWKPREEQKASLYLEESMVEVEVVGGTTENHRDH